MKILNKVLLLTTLSCYPVIAESSKNVENIVKIIVNDGLSDKTIDTFLQSYKSTITSLEKQLQRSVSIEEKYKISEKLNKAKKILIIKEQEIQSLNEFIENSNSKSTRIAAKIYEEKGLAAVLDYFDSKKFKQFEKNVSKNKKEISDSYTFKAKSLELANKYDDAKKAYYTALGFDRTLSTLSNYAYFLENQKYFNEAIHTYETMVFEVKHLSKEDIDYDLSDLFAKLGHLYSIKNLHNKAEETLLKALSYAKKSAKKYGGRHIEPEIKILHSLGSIYENKFKPEKAKKYYKDCLITVQYFREKYPTEYLKELAIINNTLSRFSTIDEHEKSLQNLLKLYKKIAKEKPTQSNLSNVASTLSSLASLYGNDYLLLKKSEEFYIEALSIYRSLAERNPVVYNPIIAELGFSAILVFNNNEMKQELLNLLVSIYSELKIVYPDVYNPTYARILGMLGDAYVSKNKFFHAESAYMEAAHIFRRLVKDNPSEYSMDLGKILLGLIMINYSLDTLNEAEKLCEKYKHLPKMQIILVQMPIFRTMIEGINKNFQYYYNRAISYFNEGAYSKSIEEYRSALKLNSSNSDVIIELANAYLYNQDYINAIDSLDQSLKLRPNNPNAYFLIGISYYSQKKYFEAIKFYRKSIAINPKDLRNIETYNRIGSIFYELKKYDKAIPEYQLSLNLSKQKPVAYFGKGDAYFIQKKYTEALKEYQDAIDVDPTYYYAYISQGKVYTMYGNTYNYSKAIELNREALKFNPNENLAYINIFQLQLIQNKMFDKELKKEYTKRFENIREEFIKYDMLMVFQNIVEKKNYGLKPWQEKYKDISLGGWDWTMLENWIKEVEDKKVKNELEKVLKVFKEHKND